MPIIKAPPKQPKSVTIQARVEEAIKNQLDRYAEFIGSTPSYVITEALKDLFRRDKEFKSWQDHDARNAGEDAPAVHHA
jgi:predicted transcriptional regulator